jgi:hypothetical protein
MCPGGLTTGASSGGGVCLPVVAAWDLVIGLGGHDASILDVEGVAEGSVKPDSLLGTETTDGFWFKVALRHRHDVVACDYARLR